MDCVRQIYLRFCSNAYAYKISLCDGCNSYSTIVNGNVCCISFLTKQKYIRIIVSPTSNEYNCTLYYYLNVTGNNYFCLSGNFSKRNIANKTYTFFLTDRTYGLPLDGNLYFNAT